MGNRFRGAKGKATLSQALLKALPGDLSRVERVIKAVVRMQIRCQSRSKVFEVCWVAVFVVQVN
eukprot:5140107-Amphidinium_carterae.1